MKKKLILGAIALALSPSLALANVDFEAQPAISDKMVQFEFRADRDAKISSINAAINGAGGMKRLIQDADSGDAESKYVLYNMYRYGIVYDVDSVKAHELLIEAVNANHPGAKLEYAYFLLGYSSIDETTKGLADPNDHLSDVEKATIALSLLMDSAYLGDPIAQYAIGSHYIQGKGLPRDRDLGMYFLSKSQSQGFKPAEDARIAIDKSLSNKHDIRQIAQDVKLGDLDSMVRLAKAYLDDYEIGMNREKAYRLLVTAEKLGSHDAKQVLAAHF